ncbi:hypothetical protein PEC301619_04680 [Pectobacterium carotovorum subsp. carotovorum]|nr:hypothetical protein PEC301619_04680 [Pectobacterium carotovorum subsp. carotovorum]
MFVWSLFVGGIVAIVVFPFGSAFFAVSKKTKEAFIDNLFCIIVFIGLLSTLFIAYR